ncbi:unnamed protein product [Ambrosiozyma monospora]|uniref:Unnamed protein product n=1 Tax=Ambrosiozyma monospora TaxID=43982 RepID=A0A9W7DFR4_AMBMO|nr:unnamed protein product [Ambrosiozyma monospora]
MSIVTVKQVITRAFSNSKESLDSSTTPILPHSNSANTNNDASTHNNNHYYDSIDNSDHENGFDNSQLINAQLSPDLEQGLSETTSPYKTRSNESSSSTSSNDSSSGLWFLDRVDPRVMSDIIIGLSDGLTVPFALTAGLSSLGDTKLVITGGFAELISGAISMGLGGYLAAKSESEYYKSQVKKEKQNFFTNVDGLEDDIEGCLVDIGLSPETIDMFLKDLEKHPKKMIDFVIKFGRGLEEPAENRQVTSALTIGTGYFLGGFVPLIPYFFVSTVGAGLLISIAIMLFTLFWFGYFKTIVTMGNDCSTWSKVSEGFQMVLIGSLAAGCAWSMVYLIGS